jgi:hypothetical protein
MKLISDNLKDRRPQDRSLVNTSESWEIQYWSEKFNCTVEQLKEALEAIGNSATDVEKYIKS